MLHKTFCSSPWFHIRLTFNGDYEPCRWARRLGATENIRQTTIMQYYNSSEMKSLRLKMLAGETPDECKTCYYEESFGKLNGRQRQLAKSAIRLDDFARSLRSSPHFEMFDYSMNNLGVSPYYPTDLQIDLGNTCNNACIMCHPKFSSRLEKDYIKLQAADSQMFAFQPYQSWTRDPDIVERFVEQISTIPEIRYIHFLGGETLFDETFYQLTERLAALGLAERIIIGATTNGTIYSDRLASVIDSFQEVHLGISIESVTELNDYVRYPSSITQVLSNIQKFLDYRKQNSKLKLQLRITPNIFSIYELDQIFDYMVENQISAESCNILFEPAYLRMELVPPDIRQECVEKFDRLIARHKFVHQEVINVRREDLVNQVIANLAIEYQNFLQSYQEPDDAESSRFQLVEFLKHFESIRKNSILDYAPRYEKFLRNYGY